MRKETIDFGGGRHEGKAWSTRRLGHLTEVLWPDGVWHRYTTILPAEAAALAREDYKMSQPLTDRYAERLAAAQTDAEAQLAASPCVGQLDGGNDSGVHGDDYSAELPKKPVSAFDAYVDHVQKMVAAAREEGVKQGMANTAAVIEAADQAGFKRGYESGHRDGTNETAHAVAISRDYERKRLLREFADMCKSAARDTKNANDAVDTLQPKAEAYDIVRTLVGMIHMIEAMDNERAKAVLRDQDRHQPKQ